MKNKCVSQLLFNKNIGLLLNHHENLLWVIKKTFLNPGKYCFTICGNPKEKNWFILGSFECYTGKEKPVPGCFQRQMYWMFLHNIEDNVMCDASARFDTIRTI